MKLEEAASILGISLEDITIDGLKQTYKKLAMALDPELCKDHSSKLKYQKISEAYRKLNSVMEGGGCSSEGHKGGGGDDHDSHEIAAFMRMFMDMVGISDSDPIPAAMTFGMMFGSRQASLDEWSTDDEEDDEYNDCDDDDCEYDDDDDEDEESFDRPHAAVEASYPPWEPQAKQYSNMNLKDQVVSTYYSKQKLQGDTMIFKEVSSSHGNADEGPSNGVGLNDAGDIIDVGLNDAEKEKKMKTAKKRADKRRKQKERRLKEQETHPPPPPPPPPTGSIGIGGAGAAANPPINYYTGKTSSSSSNVYDPLSAAKEIDYTKESISLTKSSLIKLSADAGFNQQELKRMIMLNVNEILLELTACVTNGQLGKVNQILSYDFSDEIPTLVANEMVSVLKQQLPGIPILHYCVTDYVSDGGSTSHNLAARRIEVAKYLLNFRNPALDLGVVDSSGLSVLHLAVVQGDAKVLQMIIKAIVLTDGSSSGTGSPERKNQLNINSRCHRQGWAAIHYAVDKGDLEALRVLIHSRANILVTMATDKRYTPLQLARLRLKATSSSSSSSSSAVSSVYKSIVEELESAIEQQKAAKECDKSKSNVVIDGIDMMSMSIDDLSSLLQEKPIGASEKRGNKKKKAEKKKDKAAANKMQSPSAPPVSQLSSGVAPPQKGQLPSGAAVDQKGIVKAPADKSKVASKPATVIAAATKKTSLPTVPVATPPKKINPTTTTSSSVEMSIASRDELVDRLLAMGFREADCLVAISLYGTDIDQAISWLCDRPAPAALQRDISKTKGAEATIGTAMRADPLNAVAAKPVFGSTTAPTLSNPSTEATAASSTNANSSVATSTAAVQVVVPLMQKEKEELRRINRAWNAKAEDEKRKLEAQRKQAELQKQQEALLAKQQQQEQLRLQQMQQQMYFQQQAQYLQGNGYYPLQSAAGTPLPTAGPSYSHLSTSGGSFDSCHPLATPLSASSMSIHSMDPPPPPLVVGPHKAMMPYLNTVQGTLQPQASNSSSYSLTAHQQRHTTPPMSSSSHGDMSNGMMTSSSHYSRLLTDPSPLKTNSSSNVDHLYSSPHHSTTGNYEYPNSTASETFGAPISSTQDNWSNPSYRSGQMDHLYSSSSGKVFNSSVIHDMRRGHDISTDSSQVDIVDGALELSAGAKEFVPSSARVREFSPGYGASMSNPVPPMPALTPAVSSLGLALHQHQTLLYPPSSSSSSSLLGTGSALIGSSALIGGQPPGIVRGASIPPMPPLAVNHHVNQSAWKLYHHQQQHTAAPTPFMNMGMDTGGRHLSAPPSALDPMQKLPLPQGQGQHSMFMSDYDLLLHSNHSFNAATNSSSSSNDHQHDAYEYYDPSDDIAIMTDIDSFLSTDN